MTCTNTPRLSAGDCLQDAEMLERGILHIRIAAFFIFTGILSCTCRNIIMRISQHVSDNALTVSVWCLRDTTSVSGSQTCATASKLLVPYLDCAQSMPKTGHIHLRGAHHLPLPTLCVGLHPISQGNYHWAQLTGFDAIPDEEFTSLNLFYSLLKVFFIEHVWEEMGCWFLSFVSEAFRSQ